MPRRWAAALVPLTERARNRLLPWIGKLHDPIRIGEHSQTAFSFGLAWDWAEATGDTELTHALADAARLVYAACAIKRAKDVTRTR